jgi:hypothetical protein
MKPIKTCISLVLLLALGAACTPETTPQPTTVVAVPAPTAEGEEEQIGLWEVVYQQVLERPIRMAAFLDENVGLTGGPDYAEDGRGKAHSTTDGGETWTWAESSES